MKKTFSNRTAKYWSLKIWAYLRDHPEIHDKRLLPASIQSYRNHVLRNQPHRCPLCTLFYPKNYRETRCIGCPLYEAGHGCIYHDDAAAYNQWVAADTGNTLEDDHEVEDRRQSAAGTIVDIIKAWEV